MGGRERVVGKRFALKWLHESLAKNGDIQAHFTAEARATALFAHANGIDIYDLGVDDDDTTYFVMELLNGDSLAAMPETRGAIPVVYAIELMLQTPAALSAAHERGIIHRSEQRPRPSVPGIHQNLFSDTS